MHDKEYKSDENGKFIYTAEISEDYILAAGVKLPRIYVVVGEQARAGTAVEVGTVDALQNAIADASGDTTIRLTDTINLGSTGANIPTNKTITLDLNGKTLTSGAAYTIMVSGDSNFTVTDLSEAKDGVLKNTSTGNGSAICVEGTGGEVTVSGGTVESLSVAINNNRESGNTTVSGGTVKAVIAISSGGSGSIVVSGGRLMSPL